MLFRFLLSSVVVGGGLIVSNVKQTPVVESITPADVRVEVAMKKNFGEIACDFSLADPETVRALAREAYVWGWPLVYVNHCRAQIDRVPFAAKSGGMPVAPPNQLCMLTDYISPKQKSVACSNQDVVYGFGVLDLAEQPVVLQVPDFGTRYWVFQLGDHRTDGFADVGAMYGTAPGMYLVVGPEWNGVIPAGIRGVFRCPTRLGYVLPRVYLADDAADRLAVQPLLNQIMAYPLSRYDGNMQITDWKKIRWLPQLAAKGGRVNRFVKPETFFESLAEALEIVPPLPGEEPFYACLTELLAAAKRDPQLMNLLVETARATEDEVVAPMFDFRNVGIRLPHHWTTVNNGAAFGTDYLTRTAVARSNIFVNRNHETKYFYQDLDAAGERLDGTKTYQITFPAGSLPPTSGFWSLTLYDENHTLNENEAGRYSVGTKSGDLRTNDDGSLTITVQAEAPSAFERANWLPSPAGKFSLYIRAYGPKAEILTGAWTPPPVTAFAQTIEVGG